MAALAHRFIRISVEPGFAARFRDAGNDAGLEFARSFKLRVQAALAGFNPKVKVQFDWDHFNPPPMPPINLRVGFDMTSAIQAGRRAAMVANAAAGPIILGVHAGGMGGIGALFSFANSAVQSLVVNFGQITNIANTATSSVSSFTGALGSLGGAGSAVQIGLIAMAISLIPVAVMAAIAAIYALAGALASLPALTVGLGFSVGALGLGFMGLGEHLKGAAKGGGGAAKSLSALHSAMRAVTRAQRELTKATRDIDRARADEIERIDDLGRALRGAALDEEDAAAAVARARTELAEARATGDVNAIGEADRAYRRSLLTLDEARDKTGDLTEEKAKSDRDGVEGSDQVQKALERQRDAVEQLTAAQEALADAQKSGGGGGAARQLMKLAPAAAEVVAKLKQLRPVFEDIRLAVQQELFQGVAPELQKLSDAWKAPLKSTLVSYASTFNGMFKDLSESVRKPEFVANITSAAETVRENLGKIGKEVTGPLVDAFGRLARAAKPFIDLLGDKIAGMVRHFSDWIKSADESGDLTKFFEDAAYYMGLIWDIGGNIVGLIGDIFDIIFETEDQGGTGTWLEGFNDQLIAIRDWLADPANKQRIRDFIDRIGEIVRRASDFTVWAVEEGLPALSNLWAMIDQGRQTIGNIITRTQEWWDRWRALRDFILLPFQISIHLFDGIISAMRYAVDMAISIFNGLNLGFRIGVGTGGINVSGTARNLPSGNTAGFGARQFAAGGVVRATPGGTFAQIAEAGKDEAVAPIDVLQGYVRTAVAEAGGGSGDIIIPIYMFPGAAEHDRFVLTSAERNKGALAKIVNGGNKRLGYAD